MGTSTSSKNTSLTSAPPSMVWIGRTVTPFDFIENTMKEMPICFLAGGAGRERQKIKAAAWGGGVGAAEAEDHVGVLGERRPGLLAVDDPLVALAFGLGLQRGEVGAGAGLGEALAPPIVDIGDAGQILLLLLFIAEGVDHGADHADAEGERLRRRIGLQLFVEDVVLHGGPAGAAILLGPVADAPALLVEDAPPRHHLVLREVAALDQLAPRIRRHVVAEE